MRGQEALWSQEDWQYYGSYNPKLHVAYCDWCAVGHEVNDRHEALTDMREHVLSRHRETVKE